MPKNISSNKKIKNNLIINLKMNEYKLNLNINYLILKN